MDYQVVLALSLKLTHADSRLVHLVLPFSSIARGYAHATDANADDIFALNMWKEVEAHIPVESAFNELNSIALLEAYVTNTIASFQAAVSSGVPSASKFSELCYSITTAISGTKYRALGRNLFNSFASVVASEYNNPGTRCNRITIGQDSLPIFKFDLNTNLDGTAHGASICSNRSISAADIEKLVLTMHHARPSFDFDKIKDAPTGGITIVEYDNLSQADKISFIRGEDVDDVDDHSKVSALTTGQSVLDTKKNIRMTDVLGPFATNNLSPLPARHASQQRPSSQFQQQYIPSNPRKFSSAVLDVKPNNPLNKYTVLHRNIPNVDDVLTSDFINSGKTVVGMEYLFTSKGNSKDSRWSEVISIASKRIEASHKRNTTKVEIPIPLNGLLEWLSQFRKREGEKGIYVPPFPVMSMQNVMGAEWFTGSLPDSLYERFAEMKTALQVDLEFYLSKNPVQLRLVQKQQCGYSAFHTLVMSQYTNLYLSKTPDHTLLQFDIKTMSLASFIDNMIEYLHQESVCGTDYNHYREFCLFIGKLPARYKHFLEDAMRKQMQSSPFYDSCNRVPPGCKRDGWQLFCTQVFTSVGIRHTPASTASVSTSIRSVSKIEDRNELSINAVQGKPFRCYLCQGSHKFIRCPNIDVKLSNEKYRSQFDKVFPPQSSQVAVVESDIADASPLDTDHEQEQQLELDQDAPVENGFDDDVVDNSISLFAIGSEIYRDDLDDYNDGEIALQMLPVTRCPVVCVHCNSSTHSSEDCQMIQVAVREASDEVVDEDEELLIQAIGSLPLGEDDSHEVVSVGEDTVVPPSLFSISVHHLLPSDDRHTSQSFINDTASQLPSFNSRHHNMVYSSESTALAELAILENRSVFGPINLNGLDESGDDFGIYDIAEDREDVRSTTSTSSSSISE